MSSIRVALVDDEPDFREPVARFLRKAGLEVVGVESVEDLADLMSSFRPDVIVLDVNLPGESGMEAVQRLREETRAGLIMVTARTGEQDRLMGLQYGADSYLGKPINLRELEAIVRNLHRRLKEGGSAQEQWTFNADDWTLSSPDSETVTISAAEYLVLACLTEDPGRPVGREDLFACLGKVDPAPDDRSLDVLLSRLRRKFSVSSYTLPIRSVRGIGYVFPSVVRQGQVRPVK